MDQQARDEYEVIEPLEIAVKFGAEQHKIVPLKVGQIPGFARAVKAMGAVSFDAVLNGDVAGIMDLLAEHGDAIISATSIASGIPENKIREADIDDLIRMATAIVRVNADFFARRLAPALAEVAAKAAEMVVNASPIAGDGQTRSKP